VHEEDPLKKYLKQDDEIDKGPRGLVNGIVISVALWVIIVCVYNWVTG
jgi:hypothetical protein